MTISTFLRTKLFLLFALSCLLIACQSEPEVVADVFPTAEPTQMPEPEPTDPPDPTAEPTPEPEPTDTPSFPKTPPAIRLIVDGAEVEGEQGSYCWPTTEDSNTVSLCLDRMLPEFENPTVISAETPLQFIFDDPAPNDIHLSLFVPGSFDVVAGVSLTTDEASEWLLPVAPGDYQLMVGGNWALGDASYSFDITIEAAPDAPADDNSETTIPSEPPAIRLLVNDMPVDGHRFAHCWSRGDDTPQACGGGPIPAFANPVIISAETPIQLQLDMPQPEEVKLLLNDAASGEEVARTTLDPNETMEWPAPVDSGEYLLLIGGTWPNGSASYAFSVTIE